MYVVTRVATSYNSFLADCIITCNLLNLKTLSLIITLIMHTSQQSFKRYATPSQLRIAGYPPKLVKMYTAFFRELRLVITKYTKHIKKLNKEIQLRSPGGKNKQLKLKKKQIQMKIDQLMKA